MVQWLGRWICVRFACDLREVVSGSSVVQWLGHWFCVRLLQITNRHGLLQAWFALTSFEYYGNL